MARTGTVRANGALSTAAFDATDPATLERFFQDLPHPVDHVMVTAGGRYYAALAEMDFARARRTLDDHLLLPLYVGRNAAGVVRPGGTLLFMTGTGGRRPGLGNAIAAIQSAALPALTANLALELAPVRVNLIAAGSVARRKRANGQFRVSRGTRAIRRMLRCQPPEREHRVPSTRFRGTAFLPRDRQRRCPGPTAPVQGPASGGPA